MQKKSTEPSLDISIILPFHSTMCNRTDTTSCSRQKWKIYWFLVCKRKNDQPLGACKLVQDKVFHNHMELLGDNTDNFIEQSPNSSKWEISSSEKRSTLRHLDICFNNVDKFIETMRYFYDKMESCIGFIQKK